MSKATGTPPAPTSTWSALRHAPFRTLWQSGSLYFVANAMQTMAAAWMMLQLTGSSFLAALVQTAVFLPMFLLSLPAGVLADITDRRRLILGALALQAATGTLLAALLFAGLGGPATLLFFVFVSGACTAMLSPAWNSTVADSIPRDELPNAITAVAIAYNGARALGPALAGVVFTLGNGAWNFVIAVLGALAMLQGIRSWPPKPHSPSRLPAERLWGGMLAGLRFARHSQTVLAQLVRTVAYSGAGSALWALLPVIGQRQLGLGAAGVGLLMGCMGGGAVVAGLVIGRLRARAGLEGLVALGCVLYAGAMLVAAFSTQKALVYPALGLGGACWMAVMSTFNTATQTSVPLWVRARALAMHTLCALGSFAICSAFWGALTLGRLVSIPIAAHHRPATILLGNIVGCLAGMAIVLLGRSSPPALWAGTFVFGFAMGPLFPTTISFASTRMATTGRVTAWFLVGGSLGVMTLPWLIGQLFEPLGPQVTMWLIALAMVLSVGVYGLLMLDAKRQA